MNFNFNLLVYIIIQSDLLPQIIFNQLSMDQVKTVYKISRILIKAFQEVNEICANSLADRSIRQQKDNELGFVDKANKQKPEKEQSAQEQIRTNEQAKKQTKINYAYRLQHQTQIPKSALHENKQKYKHRPERSNKQKHEAHPDKPRQPLSAFFIFQQQRKDSVKNINPDAGVIGISKVMGQIWRGFSQGQKAPYQKRCQLLRSKYQKQLKQFYNKHPEQKSKNQLKRQEAQSKKKQESESSSPVQIKDMAPKKTNKKPTAIKEEESLTI